MLSKLFRYRFTTLLVTLVIMIGVSPLLRESAYLRIAFNLVLTVIFVAGLLVVARNKTLAWLATLLAVPMWLYIWSGYFNMNWPQLELVGKVSGIVYFGLIAGRIIRFVFATRNVTWEVISAALVGYLLLGTMWGFCYAVIEHNMAGAFKLPTNAGHGSSSFFYYSFITLTTVGYGDITPVSGMARSFSMLEGIVGQCYMAVLVARLVGLQVAAAERNEQV